eukprot:9460927-Alexandrium_andersonii.AAC.1
MSGAHSKLPAHSTGIETDAAAQQLPAASRCCKPPCDHAAGGLARRKVATRCVAPPSWELKT